MRSREGPADSAQWTGALRDAVAAQTIEDALAAVLGRLAAECGAVAAAVGADGSLATWQCTPQEVLPLLAEPSLRHATEAGPTPLVRVETAGEGGRRGGAESLASGLALPAGEPSAGGGMLLLFFPPGVDPHAAAREIAVGLASLCGLLLEREFLAAEARRAREARDHFLVAIHHELRTPATAVMLEAGLLHTGMLGTLPPRLDDAIGRLESYVGDLVRVVQRVLDLGRLEAVGGQEADDLVDPRRTVIEIARRVEPTAKRRDIDLSLFFPRVLPVLQTDADRLRRILLYVLANAIKYTEGGRVQVKCERALRRVGTQRREPFLLIRVADTGRGIPAEELERVFEPFAQVEEGARTDSANRGLGLGLPLARKLACSLGGDVTVESTVGQGTTATIAIPYRQPQPD